jgi:DNA-binding MarR family transcriptional regulator
MTNGDKANLGRLINALRRFNQFDTKMQVSTILTLLESAKASMDGSPLSVSDLTDLIGMPSGTTSRNAYYWAEGHPDNTGRHLMLTVTPNASDRRRRDIELTPRGKAFLNSIVDDLR